MSILLSVVMLLGMMPLSAHATETEHTHEWHSSWSTDADGHWHICVAGDGCTEKGSYAAHEWNTNYTIKSCNTCYYYESHTHTGGTATCSDRATCELCGFLYGDTDPDNHKGNSYTPNDADTHKVSCQCGVTKTESEAHGFLDWYDNGDGRETRYCMWCGSIIARGEEIPAKGYVVVKIDDDADVLDVTFTTAEGVTLPDDAEVVVKDHTAAIEPIAGLVGEDANTEYVSLDDKDIEITEPIIFTYDAIAQLAANKKYNVYEIGANEISIKNATAVSGTVTQTFEVPTQFVGNVNVKYIAYAFIEEDEPEIKTLSATIVDGATEQPASLTWLWITIAVAVVAGGGFAVYWFVIRKRRTIKHETII